jgi:hypothetical protein
MHDFALIESRNLTVMIPSGSCYRNERKKETVSDQPGHTGQKKKGELAYIVQHNVRDISLESRIPPTPSLRSKSNERSSSNSSRVNMCLRTTTLFAWLGNLSVTAGVGPNSSSESQSSNFLSLSIRFVQQEAVRKRTFASRQSSSSPSSYPRPSSPLLLAHPDLIGAYAKLGLSEPSSS